MRSVELFSGCGGLALGIARAGFRHLKMVEWNADACATLNHNKDRGVKHVRHWPLTSGDVRLMDWSKIGGPIDLVAGGPPCQPFSIGGKHKGSADHRDMWPEAIRAVRELRPLAFLFENVRGLARPAFADYLQWINFHLALPGMAIEPHEDHAGHLRRLMDHLRRAEYQTMVIKVNAADFGAPQKRHRVVVAGVRRDLGVSLVGPSPTHSRERLLWEQWVTGDYWRRHGMPQPDESTLDQKDRRKVESLRVAAVPPAGSPWMTVRDALAGLGEPTGRQNHVFQDGARTYPGHTGSPMDEPAKALKAGDHGVPGGENMMVRDDGSVRYFTVREAARLQGLPDDWEFMSSWTESMRQLGNAVPTQLAESMARWLANLLRTVAPHDRKAA